MPYKALFDETRWDSLIEQFRQENYRLFQLASQSVFTVALQAGLSALKTPYPFCAYFNTLTAFNLYAKAIHLVYLLRVSRIYARTRKQGYLSNTN